MGDTWSMAGFRVRRAPSLFRMTEGFVVVASVDGRSAEMAGSAAAIWAVLPSPDAEPVTIAELVTQLATRYDAALDDVERDALAVVESLEAIGCAVRFA